MRVLTALATLAAPTVLLAALLPAAAVADIETEPRVIETEPRR